MTIASDTESPDQPPRQTSPTKSGRSWWLIVGLILLAGLGLRLGFVASYEFTPFHVYGHPCQGKSNYPGCESFLHHVVTVGIGGDALYYHDQAHLLLEGKVFIDPSAYYGTGAIQPSASHPPLYTMLVAIEDLLGFTTVDRQRIFGCFVGTVTVLVIALVARKIAGKRAGIVGALVAAFYPGLWVFDGNDMSESLSILVIAYLIYESYRYWQSPSLKKAAWVGFLAALCAYTRSELILLGVLVVLPLAWLRPGDAGRWRACCTGLGILLLALAPWIGFNLARFQEPELLSTQFGTTLVVSNCPSVYYGPFTGFWDLPRCQVPPKKGPPPPPRSADESIKDAYWRHVGLDYLRAHLSRFPAVVAAREGRVWWLYQPSQQATLNSFIEDWDLGASQLFRWTFYVLAPLAIVGAVMMKRKGELPLFPLLGPIIVVFVAVFVTYGTTRFQSSAEPTIVVLSAISITGALQTIHRRVTARSTSAIG